MISAADALDRLRQGNRRFVDGLPEASTSWTRDQLAEMAGEQRPFAIILGCSDSRVPAEIVFDQGIGDLFVIRVAGNVVAPSQVASVEFAAAKFGTRLVVVLGHTGCGAIEATIEALHDPSTVVSPNLRSIVERVRPSVAALMVTELAGNAQGLAKAAVRANIAHATDQLRHGSEILESQIRDDGLRIVGAEYDLETGVVEILDVPEFP